jgi:tRNA threonylcarbamoyladenosine biosynthesis protein TsaB
MELMKAALLAIESSGKTAHVAIVAEDGTVLAARTQTEDRHAPGLLGLCDEVLSATGLQLRDLSALACGEGPGSFTGLRIGLCTAKGFALPLGLPLVLVSSLQALAHDLFKHHPDSTWFLPCIDAGKGEIHAQMHRLVEGAVLASEMPRRMTPEMLCAALATGDPKDGIVVGGSGLDRFRDIFATASPTQILARPAAGPTAEAVAAIARSLLATGQTAGVSTSTPHYGRAPDITQPRKRSPGT